MPEYQEAIDRIAFMLQKLSYYDLNVMYNTFSSSGDLLFEQAVLHPCLVSVLGNALFLKILLPIDTNHYNVVKTSSEKSYNEYKISNFKKLINSSIKSCF